jgi:hypothetical protein
VVQLNAEDVIRGLKRLKSLAKQDILISSRAPDPEFWLRTATARKEKYEVLIALVEEHGVQRAYQIALNDYLSLAATVPDSDRILPCAKGEEQALEIFFRTLGFDEDVLQCSTTSQLEVGEA